MVKYFVKKHCEATEMLGIAVDRVQDYFYGKNISDGYVCKNREPKSFEGTLYGFDSEAEAGDILNNMKSYYENKKMSDGWVVTLSVVEA